MSRKFREESKTQDSDIDSEPDTIPHKHTLSDKELPWIEKYRPKTLTDVSYQEDSVQMLQKSLQSGNLPHLLFYGPPGTGKTSTILAVARQLYGPELMRKRVLELNASNERGIDVIRNKVKDFASIAVSSTERTPGYPCPQFKIIILDEADSMTRDAQSALRRTMEQYSKVTRFCIICNYVSKIIEPITSRCAKFRYKLLSSDSMIQRLQYIAEQENIQLSSDALNTLVQVSDGDMRKSITMLQSANRLVLPNEQMTAQNIIEVAGVIPANVIAELIHACKQNRFVTVQNAVKEIIYNAYPVDQILVQLSPAILDDNTISDVQKGEIIIHIAETDARLIDGGDEYLQLLDVASFIATTITQT